MILLHPYNMFMIALLASFSSITTTEAAVIYTSAADKLSQHLASDEVSCNILLRIASKRPNDFFCVTDDHIKFRLTGDVVGLIERPPNARSGPRIVFPSFVIGDDGKTIDVDDKNISPLISISPLEAAVSSAERLDGRFKALVIRVVDSTGSEPGPSEKDLHQYFFKKNFKNPSAAEVFEGCSNNKFTIVPAAGSAVNKGVITITIGMNTKCMDPEDFENEVMAKLESMNGIGKYSYLMIVSPTNADWSFGDSPCPTSPSDEWSGYAVGEWLTHYNGRKSKLKARSSVIVHEIGHNLGLAHSGWDYDENGEDEYDERYDDTTCTMGSSVVYNTDRRCFNAAKTYYLGWFSEHTKDVTPTSGGFSGSLVSVNDVVEKKNSPGQLVTVRIVAPQTSRDLFMMYNLMEGVNDFDYYEDVFDKRVVIVSQDKFYAQSWIRAYLSEGEMYTYSNWDGTSKTLEVKVCSITPGDPDKVVVGISLGGVKGAGCSPKDTCTALTKKSKCKKGKCAWFKPKCVSCATITGAKTCRKKKCVWKKKKCTSGGLLIDS